MIRRRLHPRPRQSPENPMADRDRLSNLILEHWSRYQPSMLAQLRQENRLEQVLEETAQQFSDLLYDLVSVRKMEYHQAWEIAIDQFLLPEESSLSPSPKASPHATSG
jgi:hypothetical protein